MQKASIYTQPFTQCNWVRIPPIVHGLYTPDLMVLAYDNDPVCPHVIVDMQLTVDRRLFIVECIFRRLSWDPMTQTWGEELLPPQSGVVVITAPTLARSAVGTLALPDAVSPVTPLP